MITRVNHIGIAVNSIEEAKKLYNIAFGLKVGPTMYDREERTNIAWVPVGNIILQLMEPVGQEGLLAKFLQKRGEGIHHLNIEVTDMDEMVTTLRENGIPLVDEKPRIAADGTKHLVIHPSGTGKVLFQSNQHGPKTFHGW